VRSVRAFSDIQAHFVGCAGLAVVLKCRLLEHARLLSLVLSIADHWECPACVCQKCSVPAVSCSNTVTVITGMACMSMIQPISSLWRTSVGPVTCFVVEDGQVFSIKKEHVPEEAVKRSIVLSDLLTSNGSSGPVPVSAEAVQTWVRQISRTAAPRPMHQNRLSMMDGRPWSQIRDNLLVREPSLMPTCLPGSFNCSDTCK
jgi:hypothetical protein